MRLNKWLLGLSAGLSLSAFGQQKKNVLFIAVDDLKPVLGCYGDKMIKTPNIDELAKRGTVFTNAHCQQAVSGPTRASLLTGMRPDYTGVWDLKTRMRDINPDILSLPQHFKNEGYKTVAVGKIYDPRCVAKDYDGQSWSIPYAESSELVYPEQYGEPGLGYYTNAENKARIEALTEEAKTKGVKNIHGYVSERFKPSVECSNAPDEAHMDGQISNQAISYLKEMASSDKPFFLAVGFKKPHLPFTAPKKYWDLYDREKIPLAEYTQAVKDGVDLAYTRYEELQSYTDIPALESFSDIFSKQLPIEKQKELIHGYYACVSFIDAQVGELMKALKASGLDKNTVIVLWGDHGWHLGDHALWCKHTNFEQATRVPMIFSLPGQKASVNSHPAEFVDIFPTLCDAAGISQPNHLQGTSLVKAIKDPSHQSKAYAVSQFGRGKAMGYSLRTDRYRMTLWLKDGYRSYDAFDENLLIDGELYDYQKDPNETQNHYNLPEYKKVKAELMAHFVDYFKSQSNELKASNSKNYYSSDVKQPKGKAKTKNKKEAK